MYGVPWFAQCTLAYAFPGCGRHQARIIVATTTLRGRLLLMVKERKHVHYTYHQHTAAEEPNCSTHEPVSKIFPSSLHNPKIMHPLLVQCRINPSCQMTCRRLKFASCSQCIFRSFQSIQEHKSQWCLRCQRGRPRRNTSRRSKKCNSNVEGMHLSR